MKGMEEACVSGVALLGAEYPDVSPLQRKRFLDARDGDVDAAREMLAGAVAWREEHGIAELGVESEGMHEQLLPGKAFLHRYDNEGRPVIVVRMRSHVKGKGNPDDAVLHIILMVETAIKWMYPPVYQFTVVVDFTGSSMKNYDTAMLKRVLHVLQTVYPERLGKMWMLNSPWVFSGVWRLVKGMLHKRTVSKIQFVGSDYGDVLPDHHFPPECLLSSMGGSSLYEYDYATSGSLGVLFPIPPVVADHLVLDDDLLDTDPFGEHPKPVDDRHGLLLDLDVATGYESGPPTSEMMTGASDAFFTDEDDDVFGSDDGDDDDEDDDGFVSAV